MVTWVHPFYKQCKNADKRKFVNVNTSGNVHSCLLVNGMNDKRDVEELFNIFECKKSCLCSIETDDINNTIYYVGMKKI